MLLFKIHQSVPVILKHNFIQVLLNVVFVKKEDKKIA